MRSKGLLEKSDRSLLNENKESIETRYGESNLESKER